MVSSKIRERERERERGQEGVCGIRLNSESKLTTSTLTQSSRNASMHEERERIGSNGNITVWRVNKYYFKGLKSKRKVCSVCQKWLDNRLVHA